MIKVLVVDDDKLVRRGLISIVPWEKFNMKVVGEASNGLKALEFCESHEVDLLMTDLSMPIMSGIELMRIVRKQFPQLHIVVLTLHQDFEYIQESLRLGAIDYIAKVELEEEQIEEVLERITTRINEKANLMPKPLNMDKVMKDYRYSYVFHSMESELESSFLDELQSLQEVFMLEVNRKCWVWLANEDQKSYLYEILSNKVNLELQSVLLFFANSDCDTWNDIQSRLMYYCERLLFYEYKPDNRIIHISLNTINIDDTEVNEFIVENVKDSWLYAAWFNNNDLFQKLIQELKSMKLQEKQLMGLLHSFVIEWNRLFTDTKLGKIKMIYDVQSWYEVEQWLLTIRQNIKDSLGKPSYSQEMLDYMTKAVLMVQEELDKQLTASMIAQRLNLSRSYFSQCFKDIIGKTFNSYSRFVRIERAKEYLINTNHTIIWIAGQTGYTDEKYFSRIFRELTGMLPSEYRLYKRNSE